MNMAARTLISLKFPSFTVLSVDGGRRGSMFASARVSLIPDAVLNFRGIYLKKWSVIQNDLRYCNEDEEEERKEEVEKRRVRG